MPNYVMKLRKVLLLDLLQRMFYKDLAEKTKFTNDYLG
jgi:hypothetical protein